MKPKTLLVALLASCVALPALAKTPADIRDYLNRRSACEHFGGEEPYDRARARELDRATHKYRCNALSHDWKSLQHRYRHDRKMTRVLNANRP